MNFDGMKTIFLVTSLFLIPFVVQLRFPDVKPHSMRLKYQELIEQKKGKTKCPQDRSIETEILAFRWVVSPIESNENFLPYFKHCELKNRPIRINAKDDNLVCSACGLSMFKTLESAKEKYNGIPSPAKQMLGYTHVANCPLQKNMGIVNSNPFSDHFDFYEYEEIDLKDHFVIVDSL